MDKLGHDSQRDVDFILFKTFWMQWQFWVYCLQSGWIVLYKAAVSHENECWLLRGQIHV